MGSIVVLSPSRRENALGRALAVALLADLTDHEVRVFAPDDGPEWIGAAQFGLPTTVVRDGADLVAQARDLPPPLIAWVVKPLPSSVELGRALERELGARLVLDVDDDDAALSEDFARSSLANRLRMARRPNLRPRAIRTALDQARSAGVPMTYSSEVLATALRLPEAPAGLRVPHPRLAAPAPAARPGRIEEGRVHLGFLGTPRLHKGLDTLRDLIGGERRFVLHLFAGDGSDGFAPADPQVVRHPGTEPLAELYAALDLVLLPQGRTRGARLQLPAKLLDAMRGGVPTLATPTPPIEEIGGSTVVPVADWSDRAAVAGAIERTASSELGRAARARFEESFSAEAQLPAFAAFIDRVGGGPGSRAHAGS
jgi:glycosyltransferase involved in cell wall biosynthesis